MRDSWAVPATVGAVAGAMVAALVTHHLATRFSGPERPGVADGLASLVGGTPLVRIGSLSDATGREVWGIVVLGGLRVACHCFGLCVSPPLPLSQILAKAEFLNPGGSVKDRVALSILRDAAARGALPLSGGAVTEGTSGSTGVSLALLAPLFGARTSIWMPDDAAQEKSEAVSWCVEGMIFFLFFFCFSSVAPITRTLHTHSDRSPGRHRHPCHPRIHRVSVALCQPGARSG